jgi:hypothetical protein
MSLTYVIVPTYGKFLRALYFNLKEKNNIVTIKFMCLIKLDKWGLICVHLMQNMLP